MTNEEAVKNLKILEKRWTEDEEMFSSTITIEIDEEFMQSIYKAISALEKQYENSKTWEEVLQELEILIRGCDILLEDNDDIQSIMFYGGKIRAYEKIIEVIKQKLETGEKRK